MSADLELVPLALGQVLYESGETMRHAYFPIDCVVSILYVMKNGESAEIAIVGNEGMIGIALFMGGDSTMSRAIVQNAGSAYRLKAQVLKDEFHRGKALSRLLLMFSSALITQMVQTAAWPVALAIGVAMGLTLLLDDVPHIPEAEAAVELRGQPRAAHRRRASRRPPASRRWPRP